mmetsp:Transcript_25906/g.46011  ORF Transcript_25906/g.46011 Transcript_25906/m.46011 type:complete len:195 (+) Transcript_25906:43-627(+)
MQAGGEECVVVVLMGVSGSGKSSVGVSLSRIWQGSTFEDGDDYHPEANKQKMRKGLALNDSDRKPWLDRLRHLITSQLKHKRRLVLACSALKKSYRDILRGSASSSCGGAVRIVLLDGSFELIQDRLRRRKGHFFDPQLLSSQFQTLERPKQSEGVSVVSIVQNAKEVAAEVLKLITVRRQQHVHTSSEPRSKL